MIKRMKQLLAAALVALPATAGATLIDFDNAPGGPIASGTLIGTQYSSLGVTFFALEDAGGLDAPYAAFQFAATASGAGSHSGNSLWNCNVGCGARADTIRMVFSTPVANVVLWTDSEGGSPITFKAYDSLNTLLQTVSSVASYPDFVLTQFTVSGISRIDAEQPHDGWGWSMDNLSFDAAAPEPMSVALLGIGLALFGVRRRRAAK